MNPKNSVKFSDVRWDEAELVRRRNLLIGKYVDADGIEKKVFSKKIDPNPANESYYPKNLAYISVASSTMMRVLLGEREADERLVFDDQGILAGTLSIALDGYEPLPNAKMPLPADYDGIKDILDNNILELLLVGLVYHQDDATPANTTRAGLIDNDMTLSPVANQVKGNTRGNPGRRFNFIMSWIYDLLSLKMEVNNQKSVIPEGQPFYYPYNLPQNIFSLLYKGVVSLDRNPDKTFHPKFTQALEDLASWKYPEKSQQALEQVYGAALKIIMTFNPVMLRQRLEDQFGDLPLDYDNLPEGVKEQVQFYRKQYPNYFDEKSTFIKVVDFMMAVNQAIYDNFYYELMLSVDYPNSYGKTMPGFLSFLRGHPGARQAVVDWASKQNEVMQSKGNAEVYAVSRQHDINYMGQRYHKFYRDSQVKFVRSIGDDLGGIINSLTGKQSIQAKRIVVESPVPQREGVTEATQLFKGDQIELNLVDTTLDSEAGSDLRRATLDLVDLYNQFNDITKRYYDIADPKDLQLEKNIEYRDSLQLLYDRYKDLGGKLGAPWDRDFAAVAGKMAELLQTINLQDHLDGIKPEVKGLRSVNVEIRDQTIDKCLYSLFTWVRDLDKDQFCQLVNKALQKYELTINRLITASRRKEVEGYLDQLCTNDQKLAMILAAKGHETGSFNSVLVSDLLVEMLEPSHGKGVDYPVIRTFMRCNPSRFSSQYLGSFTEKAIGIAKQKVQTAEQSAMEARQKAQQDAIKALYQWVEPEPARSGKTPDLMKIYAVALDSYNKGKSSVISFGVFGSNRSGEVKKIIQNGQLAQSAKLARIFNHDHIDDKSFSYHFLLALVKTIKSDTPEGDARREDPGYQEIQRLETKQQMLEFLPAVKEDAKARVSKEAAAPRPGSGGVGGGTVWRMNVRQ